MRSRERTLARIETLTTQAAAYGLMARGETDAVKRGRQLRTRTRLEREAIKLTEELKEKR